MKRRRSTSRVDRGFTLVELVLVLFIIGVVAAIAIPRFAQATARQQLFTAADRVIADLNETKIRARAASQTATLKFDVSDNSYDFDGVGGDAATIQLDESPYDIEISEVDFGGSAAAVFNGYGEPQSAGYVDLVSSIGAVRVTLDENGEASR